MPKSCGFCGGVILANEDHWRVDEIDLHITLRPGANGSDPFDTCYWAFKREARKNTQVVWPATVFQLKWRR